MTRNRLQPYNVNGLAPPITILLLSRKRPYHPQDTLLLAIVSYSVFGLWQAPECVEIRRWVSDLACALPRCIYDLSIYIITGANICREPSVW